MAFCRTSPAKRLLEGSRGISSSAKPMCPKTGKTGSRAMEKGGPQFLHPQPPGRAPTRKPGRGIVCQRCVHRRRIEGLTEAESAPLLQFLFAHQVSLGSLAGSSGNPPHRRWGQRRVQRNPVNDYHGHKRLMHRITLQGRHAGMSGTSDALAAG